jgi:hypothetical protein
MDGLVVPPEDGVTRRQAEVLARMRDNGERIVIVRGRPRLGEAMLAAATVERLIDGSWIQYALADGPPTSFVISNEGLVALTQYERANGTCADLDRERALMADLGLPTGGFWAASKRGGPVHFWERVSQHPVFGGVYRVRACRPARVLESGMSRDWYRADAVGRPRDPRTVRRICRACREAVLALT